MRLLPVALLAAAAAVACPHRALAASPEPAERIAASCVLALGRPPSSAELAQSTGAGALSVAELIARHRARIAGDPALRRAVADRACRDALGEPLPADEPGESSPEAVTYSELVQLRLAWLAAHPADYEAVIRRAYRFLLRRDPYPSEAEYWKQRPTLSYALLVACLEDWARRNQPGLMETSGVATVSVNSEFLTALRLSPEVAAEARAAIGLPAADTLPPGHHLVAPGGAGVATAGGIHFAAAGALR